MNKKYKKRNKLLLGTTMTALVIAGVLVGMMVVPNILYKTGVTDIWNTVKADDAAPGSGVTGVINVYIYPHQADGSTYDNNVTEGTAYAHFDASPGLNDSLEGDVPYNTAFDIVVKCQYNYTHAYNITAPGWDADYVRGLISCSDLSIGADTTMSESAFFNTTGNGAGDTTWIHFYMNNSGSGYQISHGESVNVTDFKQQYYG